MNIKEIKIDDFFLSPVENLTFSLTKSKTNILVSYPNLTKVEFNSLTDFKGSILIDNKKISSDEQLNKLKEDICYINSELEEDLLKGSLYFNLLNSYLIKNNHLHEVYLSLIKEIDDKKEKLNLEKEKLINNENKEYELLIKKLNNSFETKINKLKSKNDEKSLSKISNLETDKSNKLQELENNHLYNLKIIDDEFTSQSNIDASNQKNIIRKAKIQCKKIYKKEKRELKRKIREINKDKVLNFDEKEDEIKKEYQKFYLKTFLPKKEGKAIIDEILEKLGFNISFYLKHKQYNKFSFIEQIKLNILVGMLNSKKAFVLDLLDNKYDSNSQVILINDIKNLISKDYPNLIITNNVDNINLVSDDSYIYFALEGKTIEYGYKQEITSSCLVPLVQKLIKKDDISQEDLDLLLDLDGKLVEILPNHFILANLNQVQAYKRLLSYQEHIDNKKNSNDSNSNKVDSSPSLSKKEADEIANNVINDVVKNEIKELKKENKPSKLDSKLKKNNNKVKNKSDSLKHVQVSLFSLDDIKKEDNEKIYLIEKREDGKWALFLSNSNKTIKLFSSQKEASEYAKNLASKSNSKVFSKSSKGNLKGKFTKI